MSSRTFRRAAAALALSAAATAACVSSSSAIVFDHAAEVRDTPWLGQVLTGDTFRC